MAPWVTTLVLVFIVWWIGTGVVLYLQQTLSARSAFTRWSLVALSAACVAGLWLTKDTLTVTSAVSAFVIAVTLWGVVELSYYLGFITGIHKRPCPPESTGLNRFSLALGASVWHELLALSLGLVLCAALIGTNNPTGAYTYLVLWLMRWSAKLNLFLGVPHFQADWFPTQFDYLKTYLKQAPVSWFFPVSVACASWLVVQWVLLSMSSTGASALVYSLPAALLVLAIIEHGFMALPIAESRLWNGLFNTRKAPSSRIKR